MDVSRDFVDFKAIEDDVDEDGCITPPVTDDDGLGVETRYARIEHIRGTNDFVEFIADYQDVYVATRVPWDVLLKIIEDKKPDDPGSSHTALDERVRQMEKAIDSACKRRIMFGPSHPERPPEHKPSLQDLVRDYLDSQP